VKYHDTQHRDAAQAFNVRPKNRAFDHLFFFGQP
jgi:hypothetical protein